LTVRILVLMLQSIRASTNHGGSSKMVKNVCRDLVAHGHRVTLLCGATSDNDESFELDGVSVKPELPFRQSWQDTWYVPPADLTRIMSNVAAHAADADKVVIFDSHLPYPDLVPPSVPVVWSLRDFVYAQAMQGSMAFRRDLLIAPSDYVRDAYCDTVQSWLPGIGERVITIRNGVDHDLYRPSDPTRMRGLLRLGGGPVVLFPHRPDEAKGFGAALELCRRLSADRAPNVKLVIPRGTDVTIMPEVRDFYVRAEATIRELGIARNVVFSDWLAPEEMPELYSVADVTLCLGDIVEACSNATLESLACCTPVIASNIACYREFPAVVQKVPVADLDAAESAILRVLDQTQPRPAPDELSRQYGHRRMLDAFRCAIESATVRAALTPQAPRATAAKIPVWISEQRGSLYDEYRKCVLPDLLLRTIWAQHGHDAFEISPGEDIDRLVRGGALVHAA
jgi:glycosyltransferase involved in cell wall biosynthesis